MKMSYSGYLPGCLPLKKWSQFQSAKARGGSPIPTNAIAARSVCLVQGCQTHSKEGLVFAGFTFSFLLDLDN